MAARTLGNMRKAQSLLRDCHDWLVKNNETLLALEFCHIEGQLALLFDRKCFETSPCPGLQLELSQPLISNDPRRRSHRGPRNRGHGPAPASKGGSQAPVSRGSGRERPPTQATKSSHRSVESAPARPKSTHKVPQAPVAVKKAAPPTGVLVDIDNDVEAVGLSPSMVAEMEDARLRPLHPEQKHCLREQPAVTNSDEPGPGVLVKDAPVSSCRPYPVMGGSLASVSSVTDPSGAESPETFLALSNPGRSTEGILVELDDDVTVVLPARFNVCIDGIASSEEDNNLAAVLDYNINHNTPSEDEDDEDEVVFEGNKAMGIRSDFYAVFVSSDDDPENVRSAINLTEVFEKYSEVIICK